MAEKEFKTRNIHAFKRIKSGWRKPTGTGNKMRKEYSGKPEMPKVGRKVSRAWRGKHPSGRYEFFVRNLHDLSRVNEKTEAIRISAAVGEKKREEILKKAKEMNLKVLNP